MPPRKKSKAAAAAKAKKIKQQKAAAAKKRKEKERARREKEKAKNRARKEKEKAKKLKEKEKAKKEKEKAKAKKAAKPKRARSAYTYFVAQNRSKIQEEHPEWSFKQLAKALGLAWKNCPDKAHYQKLAQQDKVRASKERAAAKAKKPKRAMSAYMFFVKDNRGKIAAQNSDLSFAEIGKALGLAWKNASDKARKKYTDMAAKDKARAEREKKRKGF